MKPGFVVYVVDDESGLRKALTRLLQSEGYTVESFASAQDFLAGPAADRDGCLVLDVAMPGIDGLELQRRLTAAGARLPIIFLTGHGDIPMSVRAIKAGAADFLAKPVDESDLLRAVREARQKVEAGRAARAQEAGLRARLDQLTPREREVLEHLLAGKLNKQIAADLGTVEHTIKVHRGRVMQKMGLASFAELVRAAERLGIKPAR